MKTVYAVAVILAIFVIIIGLWPLTIGILVATLIIRGVVKAIAAKAANAGAGEDQSGPA